MLREILEGTPNQEKIYKALMKLSDQVDKMAKQAPKQLPEGERLKASLEKIASELWDEAEFVGRGEYN